MCTCLCMQAYHEPVLACDMTLLHARALSHAVSTACSTTGSTAGSTSSPPGDAHIQSQPQQYFQLITTASEAVHHSSRHARAHMARQHLPGQRYEPTRFMQLCLGPLTYACMTQAMQSNALIRSGTMHYALSAQCFVFSSCGDTLPVVHCQKHMSCEHQMPLSHNVGIQHTY